MLGHLSSSEDLRRVRHVRTRRVSREQSRETVESRSALMAPVDIGGVASVPKALAEELQDRGVVEGPVRETCRRPRMGR